MKLLKQHINIEVVDNNYFFHGDSRQLFEQNLKTMPSDWIWRTKKIQYLLNSQNYRAPEWSDINWNDSYLVFGCSDVFGVGINYTDTFTHHLSELLETNVVNLGAPGSSALFQWLNTITLIEHNVRPKGVVYFWPSVSRTTTFHADEMYEQHGPWSNANIQEYTVGNIHHCLKMTSCYINSVDLMWSCPTFHFHRVKEVCQVLTKLTPIYTRFNSMLDQARDYRGRSGGVHQGAKCNFDWANQVYDVILKA